MTLSSNQFEAKPGDEAVPEGDAGAAESGSRPAVGLSTEVPPSARPAAGHPNVATPEERLFRCWQRGNGIGETRVCLKKWHGLDLSAEEVRRRFVVLSERFG